MRSAVGAVGSGLRLCSAAAFGILQKTARKEEFPLILTERYQRIWTCWRTGRMVTVQELCDSLYASPATIRRDLAALESYNLITRTHGGAVLYEGDSDEPAAQSGGEKT